MALTFVSTLAAYVLNAPATPNPVSSVRRSANLALSAYVLHKPARPLSNLAMGLSNIEDCMLLSIFFNDGTTVEEVEALVHSYPFEGLRGFASVDKDAPDGTRLTFAEDGGARFVAVPDDNDATLISCLDIWRVAEGMGDIAPVIREKQLCRKMVDHIIQNDGGRLYKRHYKRPFGSGEGMGSWNPGKE